MVGGVDCAVRVLSGVGLIAGVRAGRRPCSPAELARRLDPSFRVTPTIRLLSDNAVRSVRRPDQRDITQAPPRTGKSELWAVYTPVWALSEDPDMQIAVICNGDKLAQEHSGKVRDIVREHGDWLGFRIAPDKTAVGRWKVQGRKGGMLAAGINSNIVGFGAHLMILDDVVGGASEADSAAHRRQVLTEWRGSLSTRVFPGGSVSLVMSRWHDEDLAGSLLRLQPGRWRVTNVPAVSDPRVADALGRPAGVAMVSALGFTAADFAEKRVESGERIWAAQYMGSPQPLEGGLVKQAWFDVWRLAAAPAFPVRTVVAIDPSDSGSGDSCGIIAASLTRDGVVALIADKSAPMTSDEWARVAVDLAIDLGASQITVEGFSARETYLSVLRRAWDRAVRGGVADRSVRITAWPPKGRSRVGDSVARSAGLLQALETGMCRVAPGLAAFEAAAVLWQAGQHQPDSLAAAVIAHDELDSGVGRRTLGLSGVPGAGAAGGVPGVGGVEWFRRRPAG